MTSCVSTAQTTCKSAAADLYKSAKRWAWDRRSDWHWTDFSTPTGRQHFSDLCTDPIISTIATSALSAAATQATDMAYDHSALLLTGAKLKIQADDARNLASGYGGREKAIEARNTTCASIAAMTGLSALGCNGFVSHIGGTFLGHGSMAAWRKANAALSTR